jgi:hypothetical protein
MNNLDRDNVNDFDNLRRSSGRSAIISTTGILIFLSSSLFAGYNWFTTNKELQIVNKELQIVKYDLKNAGDSLTKEKKKVDGLKLDESQLNQFLINLIKSTQTNQGIANSTGNDIDWNSIKKTIVNLPPGKRKLALTIALLTTWKKIPFGLGKNTPRKSFDSPGYIQYILGQVGINIVKKNHELLSVALMKHFKKVDKPLPGDLIIYRGEVGNFGLFYICPNGSYNNDIAIGTLETKYPLTIQTTKYLNSLNNPFIGYYRVNYE